jgi:hypothetical protein
MCISITFLNGDNGTDTAYGELLQITIFRQGITISSCETPRSFPLIYLMIPSVFCVNNSNH